MAFLTVAVNQNLLRSKQFNLFSVLRLINVSTKPDMGKTKHANQGTV